MASKKARIAREYGYFLSDWPDDEHFDLVKGVDYQVDDVYADEDDDYSEESFP